MLFHDVREYIERLRSTGELREVQGANWEIEIGALTKLASGRYSLLFDNIKDYKSGLRVLTNLITTDDQFKLVFGLPMDLDRLGIVRTLKQKLGEFAPVPPVRVKSGPILENVLTGNDIDLFKFPVPKWHPHDGGRYIGTANLVITKDPEQGWVNFGAYRVMVHDSKNAACYISKGRHGWLQRNKYWEKGESCPVVVVCGEEPSLYVASGLEVPVGVSEYEFAGWLRQKPVEVVAGPVTGLPIPAHAEIAFEGEIMPPEVESRMEGPFGEFTGYYASGARQEAVLRVKSILHRNDPIITGALMTKPPVREFTGIARAANLWSWLEKAGIPDIKGVWAMEPGGSRFIFVVSIRQRYSGHAKQVAHASFGSREWGYMGKIMIVVDDDVDPTNEDDVWWAVATRCDPASDIDIDRDCWSSSLDPRIEPEKRADGDFTNSRLIINACKPYRWLKSFPEVVQYDCDYLKTIAHKFKDALS